MSKLLLKNNHFGDKNYYFIKIKKDEAKKLPKDIEKAEQVNELYPSSPP